MFLTNVLKNKTTELVNIHKSIGTNTDNIILIVIRNVFQNFQ